MADQNLREWLRRVKDESIKAKERAGPIAVAAGRFRKSDLEIYQLDGASDSNENRRKAVYLLQSLQKVAPEQVPAWPLLGLLAGGLLMSAKLPKTVAQYHPGGLLVVGTLAAAVAVEVLKPGPSIDDGSTVEGDAYDNMNRANQDLAQTQARMDAEDTKQIEEEARRANQAPKRDAKKQVIVPQPTKTADKYRPEFHPTPGSDQQRFGYWKDGSFVPVALGVDTTYNGRAGKWSDKGNFVPNASN